jgi:hypothetical protein
VRSYSCDDDGYANDGQQLQLRQQRGSSISPERPQRGGYGRGGNTRSRSRSRSADDRQRQRGSSWGGGRSGSRERDAMDEERQTLNRSRSRSRVEADAEEDEMEEGQAEEEFGTSTAGGKGRRRGKAPQTGAPGRTLFVGDLPVYGFASVDLQGLFEGLGLRVETARVMGSQCYGFVEFATPEEAGEALEAVQSGDPVFMLQGRAMRASWARGSMPNWKRGKAVIRPRLPGEDGLTGLEAYEHPTARMARLGPLALPQMLGVRGGAPLGHVPGMLVGADGRGVVTYNDI